MASHKAERVRKARMVDGSRKSQGKTRTQLENKRSQELNPRDGYALDFDPGSLLGEFLKVTSQGVRTPTGF